MAPLWKAMLSRSSPLYRDALFSFSLWEWRAQERELLLLKKRSDRERRAMLAQLDKLSKELQQKDKIIESLRAKLDQHHHHHHRSDTPSSGHALSDTTDQLDRISYISDEQRSTSGDVELGSDAASELCLEETRTDFHHGASMSPHPSAPSSVSSSHHTQSCLSCPSMHCSSSPHRPAGVQSLTGFSTPQSKPLHSLPFAHQQPLDSSGFLPLSFQGFQPSPFSSAVSSSSLDAGVAMKAGASLLESSALWEMAYGSRPVRFGADLSSGSSGYQSGTSHTGSDLMQEHLREVRSLRQKLEDSIRTNDHLRQQLEGQLAQTAREKGGPTNIYIQGLDSVSQLSSEIRLLKEENVDLLAKLSDASRESRKGAEHLKKVELDAERWAGLNQKLQAEAEAHRQEVTQLKQDRLRIQETINRLQHEASVLQQQLDESRRLVHKLQGEGPSVCDVTTNTHSAAPPPAPDGSSAHRHGRRGAVGHVQDVQALQQQLLEGSSLLLKMEAALRSLNASQRLRQPSDSGGFRNLLSETRTLKRILQEAESLLRRFWRAALPDRQDEALKQELVLLHLKLSDQDRLLKDAMERLESSNLTKDSMERFIISQLSRTKDVLKRAKMNLQVKGQEAQVSSPALLVGVS